MKIKNRITEEEIELSDDSVKDIMESILWNITNKSGWSAMKPLQVGKDGYFIVSENWMRESKESKFSFELLESRLINANKKIEQIKELIK